MLIQNFSCPHCGSFQMQFTDRGLFCDNCRMPYRLPGSGPKANTAPQRIFLIAAPADISFCRTIASALKKRGHQVLMDESGRSSGSARRGELMEQIRSCDNCLAALSRQALEGPDSCLDELATALAAGAGKMQVLLLEPETDIDIPASLAHRPRLDLSAWRREKKNQAGYAKWFSRRMDQVCQLLEEPRYTTRDEDLRRIYDTLETPHITSGRQDSLLGQDFVGRDWLTRDIEGWLDSPDGSRICFLTAAAGFGKSAWAAHLSHYNHRVAAAFFCEERDFMPGAEKAWLFRLVCLLASRLPDYRARLLSELDLVSNIAKESAEEVFERLLEAPLGHLDSQSHPVFLVLIDGLDEVLPENRATLVRVLLHQAERLPGWLRFLVTWDPDSILPRDPLLSPFVYEADTGRPEHLDDLRNYLRLRLNELDPPLGAATLDSVVERAIDSGKASFLYARLFTDSVLGGKLKLAVMRQFPNGLEEMYRFWFRTNFAEMKHYREEIRDVLGAMATSVLPLPLDDLDLLFDWTEDEIGDFLRTAAVLLEHGLGIRGEETIALAHGYSAYWLLHPDAKEYQIDREPLQDRLTRLLVQLYRSEEDIELNEYELMTLLDGLAESRAEDIRAYVDRDKGLALSLFQQSLGDMDRSQVELGKRATYKLLKLQGYDMENASDPDQLKHMQVSFHRDLGQQWQDRDEPEKAYVLLQLSVTQAEELVEGRNSQDDQSELGISRQIFARFLNDHGMSDKAEANYLGAIEVQEQLLETRNSDDDRANIATTYHNYAMLLDEQGKNYEALEYLENDIAISEKLLENKKTFENLVNLAISYEHCANFLHRLDHSREAVGFYKKAIALREQLAADSSSSDDQEALFKSRDLYANFLWDWIDEDEAAREFEKNITFAAALAASEDRLEYHIMLARSYQNLADFLYVQDQNEEAKALFEKAIAALEDYLTAHIRVAVPPHLNFIYQDYLKTLNGLGETEAARALGQRHIHFYEQRQAEGDSSADTLEQLADAYRLHAEFLAEQEEHEEADLNYKHCVTLRQELVAMRNEYLDYRKLCDLYNYYSEFLLKLGRTADAIELYEQGLPLFEEVDDESDTMWRQRMLARVMDHYAAMLLELEDLPKASRFIKKNIILYDKLLETHESSVDAAHQVDCYLAYSSVLKQRGREQEALQVLGQGLERLRWLMQFSDTTEFVKNHIFNGLSEAADEWAEGEREISRGKLELFLPLLEEFVKNNPDDEFKNLLVSGYGIYAHALWTAGEASLARSYFEKQVIAGEKLLKSLDSPEFRENLLTAYENYAIVLRELRYRSQAQLMEKKARRLREQMEKEAD
ncbi:MAG: toll/interleukin-1 receptor domain-containing protein [Bacillota bacterium]|nr:toll/interleukin-1 receptor domain-containing protein [Bacillota bacterium]